jgi:hypothetical protein
MKLLCIDDGIDSGTLSNLSKRGTPETHNYRRERIYDVDESTLRRLTAIGLFPEIFEYADEAAQRWVEGHNDELCDIVDSRELPYRKLTPEEEANDRMVAKTGEGKYTLPHGVVALTRPKLVRKGKTLAETVADPGAAPIMETSRPISLTRKEPAAPAPAPAKSGRKPMSAEARKAAGERLAAARAKKKANRVPVGA